MKKNFYGFLFLLVYVSAASAQAPTETVGLCVEKAGQGWIVSQGETATSCTGTGRVFAPSNETSCVVSGKKYPGGVYYPNVAPSVCTSYAAGVYVSANP